LFLFKIDVSDLKVLQEIADLANHEIDVNTLVKDNGHDARQILNENTTEAVGRGAFGVPRYVLLKLLNQ